MPDIKSWTTYVIIDANEGQLDDVSTLIIDEGDVGKAFESFGWRAYDVDGTQYMPVYEALRRFKYGSRDGRPTVIISRTKKVLAVFPMLSQAIRLLLSDEVVNLEIQLHEKERNQRIDDLKHICMNF